MSSLTILRSFAKLSDLSSLPPTDLFSNTSSTLSIFDKYPKAKFHFLVLPRLPYHPNKDNSDNKSPRFSTTDLSSLQSLLSIPVKRDDAKVLLEDLRREGEKVRKLVEQEMEKRFGYKWGVWMGFHAVPSMLHIHLHVISSDLCSPYLKNKKHYNSFHPKLGFFLHINEVLSWFDAESSYFDLMAALNNRKYLPLLKEDLVCWRCNSEFKNIPLLKAHLQEEMEQEAERETDKLVRKRKTEKILMERKASNMSSTSTAHPHPDEHI